jgi:hypothetical protein
MVAALLITAVALVGSPALADPYVPFDVPWTDSAVRLEPARRVATLAAVGRPDERASRFSARRHAAREEAERRARGALHRYVDGVLERLRAGPRETVDAHVAIEQHARVVAVRPLVDGGAVVVVELPLGPLAAAVTSARAPWN